MAGPNGLSLHNKLRDAMLEIINDSAAGSQLPAERELARQFGVARGTMERVMRELRTEGWVVRHVGRGTFVTERDCVVTGANSSSGFLTTTGADIGTGGEDYNNSQLLSAPGIFPDELGQIFIEYSVRNGSFGYLTGLSVSDVPEPTTAGIALAGALALALRRSRRAE